MTIMIRNALAGDVPAIARLVLDVQYATYGPLIAPQLRGPFDAAMAKPDVIKWRNRVAPGSGLLRLAVTDRELIGLYRMVRIKKGFFITNFYVSPTSQGQGAGSSLFRDAVQHAFGAPVLLEVVASNERAVGFYEHMGLVLDGPANTYFGLEKVRMTTVV